MVCRHWQEIKKKYSSGKGLEEISLKKINQPTVDDNDAASDDARPSFWIEYS